MSSPEFSPWWKKVNNYLNFQEVQEFKRGVSGYRPNNAMETLVGVLSAGYVRNSFEQPKSYTGKKSNG